MTPPTTRSLPFTLHGAPAVIAGAAPEARPPVSSHANEATLAETKARREELFIRQTVTKVADYLLSLLQGLEYRKDVGCRLRIKLALGEPYRSL